MKTQKRIALVTGASSGIGEAAASQLAAAGYKGWVSADYTPKVTTAAGLGWMPPAPVAAPKKRRKQAG